MIEEKIELQEVMRRAMDETLENMVFAEISLCEPEECDFEEEESIWSTIEMIQPLSGTLTICMHEDTVREIMEEVFGMPELPEDEEEETLPDHSNEKMIFDTVGEIVNTVVGRILDELTPDDLEFDVGLPDSGRGIPPIDNSEVVYFKMNDMGFFVSMDFQESP